MDFNEGDLVWVILIKDCFSFGEYCKLSARKIWPLEIIEKNDSSAYRLRLPRHIRTSDVFNVKRLIPFHGDNLDDDGAPKSMTNFLHLEEDNVAHLNK